MTLNTQEKITWCPGCGNFAILNAVKAVISSLIEEGTPQENFVLVGGIGCHAKIMDYININSFYSLHGRAVPAAEGIKLAKPNLKVIAFAGDGDAYGEGIEHLIFSAKRNIDLTVIIHNNRNYGLTTGQFTPTSPFGFKGKSTPDGSIEYPINPLEIMLASKATFLARATSHGIELLKKIIKEAILHKGFSLIDVLQVCVTFYNLYEYYSHRIYELSEHDVTDFSSALNKIREWDYNKDGKIATGIFYQKNLPLFDDNFIRAKQTIGRDREIEKILDQKF